MTCTGPAHAYTQVGTHTVKDGATGSGSAAHAAHFAFSGFFPPVDNPPVVNVANVGRSIPVNVGLGGNQGLNIFAQGYPAVDLAPCEAGPTDAVEIYSQGSGLSYDPQTQQYNHVWKTQKSWAGRCGTFVMVLVDGTTHSAEFKFKKRTCPPHKQRTSQGSAVSAAPERSCRALAQPGTP